MKKFNTYAEALLLAVRPQSDAVAPVETDEPEEVKDKMSMAADEVLQNLGIQPDDNVGEYGNIESDSEAIDTDGIDLECLGEEGLRVKFNGMEIVLPKNVVEKIRGYSEEMGETSSEEENETKEHEDSESSEFEAGEQEATSDEDDKKEESENEDDEEKVEESKKWTKESKFKICNSKLPKGTSKEKKERCFKKVEKKHKDK